MDYERLIVRRLDGEISDEESLQLDREMLRNPEVRRLMNEYRQVDDLSAAALRSAIAGDGPVSTPMILQPQTKSARRWRPNRGWMFVPGAIAAALLALWIPRPAWQRGTASNDRPGIAPAIRYTQVPTNGIMPTVPGESNHLMRTVGTTTKRDRGRDILGVIADDGNIYWIEVDRTRTITVPPPGSRRSLDQF